jgi:5-methylcytosine-specific restriction endonuclease McrA
MARKRDNFTCQRCGITTEETGKSLDVHHIKPYREFNGDHKSAHHLDNLITLCNSCHQIVEWESGVRVAPLAID